MRHLTQKIAGLALALLLTLGTSPLLSKAAPPTAPSAPTADGLSVTELAALTGLSRAELHQALGVQNRGVSESDRYTLTLFGQPATAEVSFNAENAVTTITVTAPNTLAARLTRELNHYYGIQDLPDETGQIWLTRHATVQRLDAALGDRFVFTGRTTQ
jgi:hypothetical protein